MRTVDYVSFGERRKCNQPRVSDDDVFLLFVNVFMNETFSIVPTGIVSYK